MPPQPKRKISKTRSRKRHANWKLKSRQSVTCSKCGAPVLPHHVCMSCGTYRGTQVVEIEEG
ncbi:MAG: 50S ribosomal protein L32 [Chloroflexi bacterium]|nr:50S ribosomal protein L32 [Chloroflexota bacterium]